MELYILLLLLLLVLVAILLVLIQRNRTEAPKDLPVAYASLFDQLRDGVVMIDETNHIKALNPVAARILGFAKDDLIGQALDGFDHPTFQYLLHAQSGHTIQRELQVGQGEQKEWYELRLSPLIGAGEEVVGRMAVLHDITERKLIEAELRHTSTHDPLTGVYNRMFFDEELSRLRLGRKWPVAVLQADLDNLKDINDRMGHAAGDEMIRQAARLLSSSLRADELIARVGGDEFAVLLPGCDDAVVQSVLNRLDQAIVAYNNSAPMIEVSVSIGSAVAIDKWELDKALQQADAQMYQVKNAKKQAKPGTPPGP